MLADLVRSAAVRALGERGLDTAAVPAAVEVSRPRDPGHGDYATSVALRVAKDTGVPALELADRLAGLLRAEDAIADAEAVPPGFVNLRLAAGEVDSVVREVLAAGSAYGGGTPADRDPAVDLSTVQYVHARLSSLLRNGVDFGLAPSTSDLRLLDHPTEVALARVIAGFPRAAAAPHRLPRHLADLAEAAQGHYENCRVLPQGDEEPGPPHAARLALCAAARQVLANGLALLGTTAPERM
ncbi:hypothetical protein Acsp05_27270 [Actinokineospora sp. NBRC 105648]|nr:hypothetical protein Acsp05_27270 [Actinokineospora sp. NBRC 105648]